MINEAIGRVLFILKFISLSNFIVEYKDKYSKTKTPATGRGLIIYLPIVTN